MRRLRVLVLMHESLVPPDSIENPEAVGEWKMEWDVCSALRNLGHEVTKLGVADELAPIRRAVAQVRPHLVFNLVEEFRGEAVYDQHVVSYLELLRVPYTGCGPRGLVLCRDKALSKKILAYHRIRVPDFQVFPRGRKVRRPARLQFPLIVKSLIEESSTGISKASVVHDDLRLAERVALVHGRVETDAIAESYIDGRELYVGLLGNHRLQVLPTWELVIPPDSTRGPLIATEKVKHDAAYQQRHGIEARAADLPADVDRALVRTCRRIHRLLDLGGYARLDFRLASDGRFYFLEANPNPDISQDEELASSAEAAGIDYDALVARIVSLGLRRAHAMP